MINIITKCLSVTVPILYLKQMRQNSIKDYTTYNSNLFKCKHSNVNNLLFDKLIGSFIVKNAFCQTYSNTYNDNSKKSETNSISKSQSINSNDNKTLEDPRMKELIKKIKDLLARQQQTAEVESYFEEGLKIASINQDLNAATYVQDLMANYYMMISDLDKAEYMFKVVMRNLTVLGFTENDPDLIEISLKLATIYAHQGKDVLAEAGYKWSLNQSRIILQKLGVSKPSSSNSFNKHQGIMALLGMVLDSYGRYLFLSGKHKEALSLTNEALDICILIYGKADSRSMVLYNSVATIYMQLGDFEKASQFSQQSVKVCEFLDGQVNAEERAIIFHNYGYISFEKQQLHEAKKYLEKSFRLTENQKLKDDISKLLAQIKKY